LLVKEVENFFQVLNLFIRKLQGLLIEDLAVRVDVFLLIKHLLLLFFFNFITLGLWHFLLLQLFLIHFLKNVLFKIFNYKI